MVAAGVVVAEVVAAGVVGVEKNFVTVFSSFDTRSDISPNDAFCDNCPLSSNPSLTFKLAFPKYTEIVNANNNIINNNKDLCIL